MKYFFLILLIFFTLYSLVFAQNYSYSHIPLQEHKHDTSICWGYAQSRAYGKTTGDAFCEPIDTYLNEIVGSFGSNFVEDSLLTGIKVGDIVVFGEVRSGTKGHAAFVVHVPYPLIKDSIPFIRVDQVPFKNGPEQTNILLQEVMNEQGQGWPVGYHVTGNGLRVRYTFLNSFDAGILHADKRKDGTWITVNNGESRLYGRGKILNMEAVDGQEHNGYIYRFERWKKDNNIYINQNPISDTVDTSRTFAAMFSVEFDV